MTKKQSLLCLFLFVIIVISVDMIFNGFLQESFRGGGVSVSGGVRGVRRPLNTNVVGEEANNDEPLFFNWFRFVH